MQPTLQNIIIIYSIDVLLFSIILIKNYIKKRKDD